MANYCLYILLDTSLCLFDTHSILILYSRLDFELD